MIVLDSWSDKTVTQDQVVSFLVAFIFPVDGFVSSNNKTIKTKQMAEQRRLTQADV